MIVDTTIFKIAQVALTARHTGFSVVDVEAATGTLLQEQAEVYMAEGYIPNAVYSVVYADEEGQLGDASDDERPYCQVIVVPIPQCLEPDLKQAVVFLNEYRDDHVGWHLTPIARVDIKLHTPEFIFRDEG